MIGRKTNAIATTIPMIEAILSKKPKASAIVSRSLRAWAPATILVMPSPTPVAMKMPASEAKLNAKA